MDRPRQHPAPSPAHRPPPSRAIDPPAPSRCAADSREPAEVLRLQQAVGNQQVQRLVVVQRSNPADPRLPASQAEALGRAGEAKRAIDAAIAAMRTSAVPEQRNAVQFITQKNWTPAALTPRHDSVPLASTIHFFPGQNNYTGSQTLDAQTTHKVSPKRTWVYVRARDHTNLDNPLAQADIQARITAAVSEIAHTKAARPGQPLTIDLYRARFNGLFGVPPFNALSTAPNPALDSRGPRTPRARAVFERVLAEDPAIRAAYDGNTGGIREMIDAYAGPEGMNRVNSPRLQHLREAFLRVPRSGLGRGLFPVPHRGPDRLRGPRRRGPSSRRRLQRVAAADQRARPRRGEAGRRSCGHQRPASDPGPRGLPGNLANGGPRRRGTGEPAGDTGHDRPVPGPHTAVSRRR